MIHRNINRIIPLKATSFKAIYPNGFIQAIDDIEILNNFEDLTDDDNSSYTTALRLRKLEHVFYSRIPTIHHKIVAWKIKNIYKGDIQKYINDVPLFFQKFTKLDAFACNADYSLLSKQEKRKNRKIARSLILYSAQLLLLIGAKGGQYITADMFEAYRDKCEQEEIYSRSSRLINSSNGKLIKFPTPFERRLKQRAENFNLIFGFEKIAKAKGYIASMITLTLPPEYHCNPSNGNISFNGATPDQCNKLLSGYWQTIRQNLKAYGINAGDDYFGFRTVEVHKDSTLHAHIMFFHHKSINQNVIDVVKAVRNEFDIVEVDDVNKSAMYPMKSINYILKSFNEEDEGINIFGKDLTEKQAAAIRTMAVRNYYNLRAYSFFGLDNKKGAWQFLLKRFLDYKAHLPKGLYDCLKNKEYDIFYLNYKDCVKKIVRNNDLLGYELDFASIKNFTGPKKMLIERQVFGILSMDRKFINDNKIDIEMNNISEINTKILSSNLYQTSLNNAKAKELRVNHAIFEFYKSKLSMNIDFYLSKSKESFSKVLAKVEDFADYFDYMNTDKKFTNIERLAKFGNITESNAINSYQLNDFYYNNIIVITSPSSDLLISASQFEDIEIEDTEYS